MLAYAKFVLGYSEGYDPFCWKFVFDAVSYSDMPLTYKGSKTYEGKGSMDLVARYV